MKHKTSKWWFTLFIFGLLGTITGAVFDEYHNFQWVVGSIALSPLSLIIRVVASLGLLLQNSGTSIWSTPLWHAVDLVSIVASVIVSVIYFRTGKHLWLILFGISFGILNLGNFKHFVAMMSI
jgi:hypothetical protein